MTPDQTYVFGLLTGTLALFIIGRWRFDVVAMIALLVATAAGIVPAERAFAGFGHPAVITVAAILVVSRGLLNSGVVDSLARAMSSVGNNPTAQVASLTVLVTAFSAFMNNIGALALLLPVGVRMARKSGRSPSFLLMPLAFGSLLGGMTTLIGTPPNIIIASFRAQASGTPFRMFDFSPVGVAVAMGGLLFIALIGWRLIPERKGQSSPEELFQIKDYVAEAHVPEESNYVGKPLYELESIKDADVTIVGLMRGKWRIAVPSRFEILRAGDLLIVEADPESLNTLLDQAQLKIEKERPDSKELLGSDDVSVMEAVIMPDSPLEGNTPWTFHLRWRYGLNVLGVARMGARLKERLRNIHFKTGDVLLLQGATESIHQALAALGCLPLAERGLRLGQPRRVILAIAIFAAALAFAASGLLAVQVCFAAAAVAMTLVGLLSLREVYDSIDWPIIVLLGAMIPVGLSLERSGGARLIATVMVNFAGPKDAALMLVVVLIAAMFLSDVVNNAAAAIVMAPIAVGVAGELNASPDPFLIAVAVGASCAFLTPIGHQSNAMVMGPGGYRFGDYWRLGLPLEVLIAVIAVPLILSVWPLGAVAH